MRPALPRRAAVTDKRGEDGVHRVPLDVWTENQLGESTAKGTALVELPAAAS